MARTRRISTATSVAAIWVASAAALTATAWPRAARAQAATASPATAAATTPATAPATDAPDLTPIERADAETRTLTEALEAPTTDTTPRHYIRDEAARRLAERGTSDVFVRVVGGPSGGGQGGAKLSALRGLVFHPAPPPELIDPIKNLLSDSTLNEAAAEALAAYKDDPRALDALIAFAKDASQRQLARTVVVRAIGTIPSPQAAAALVSLLGDRAGPVRSAASDALTNLSGRRDIGQDAAAWKRWQQEGAKKSDAQWKADATNALAAGQDDLRRRNQELLTELKNRLEQEVNAAQPPQRPAVLLEILRSGVAEVRAAGVDLFRKGFLRANLTVTQELRDRLVELVGDSNVDVRVQAAQALYELNEFGAYEALLAQLPVEKDEAAKAAQLKLLGRLETNASNKRVRSVPLMRNFLSTDPSLIVAKAAAEAIQQVGPAVLKQDPALAADLAQDLQNVINRNDPNEADLRIAAINALGSLRSRIMLRLAPQLLNANESKFTRSAVMKGLGELRDPNGADIIVNWLGQEREATARLDALVALGKIGGSEGSADTFLRYMDPRQEPDPSVRDGARAVFLSLLPNADEKQLDRVAGKFKSDKEMHVAILKSMAARLEQRGEQESLAMQRQNIGVDLTDLGKPADAVTYLQQAIDYYEKQNAPGLVMEQLIGQLMRALLQSKQYPQAAAFGSHTLARDASQQPTVGPLLMHEADRLRNAGQPDDAIALVDASLQMNPPLVARYVGMLREIREQATQDKAKGAAKAPPAQ